jgi:hypothetical protein
VNPNATNPLHQNETEFQGECQVFSGPALSPDDPSLGPRVRQGRPADRKRPAATDQDETRAQE